MPHSRTTEAQVRKVMNTPDAGRFLTQGEFNALLNRDKLEAVAVLMFPRDPMEITVYGIYLQDLLSAYRASSKSPALYAEEILRDAQDAFGSEMIVAGHRLINQARWVLTNMEAK